jgi:5-methylcytosine-specific restriction endonuclease McrA
VKFELSPRYQRIPDNSLIEDLQRVAHRLSKTTVTKQEYERLGSYAQGTIAQRFGSWKIALERAGLSAKRLAPLSAEECITELKRVAAQLSKNSLTLPEYRRAGRYSESPFLRNFGTWEKTLQAAGLSVSPRYHHRVSDEQYFENIERIWISLGRQPKCTEIIKPFSAYSLRAYEGRFGSWRKALVAFVEYVNKEEAQAGRRATPDATQSTSPPTHEPPACHEIRFREKVRRTSRKPSLRLRFRVMRRDNFKCRQCGRSPAVEPGVVLEVDHIKCWAEGNETVMENLQTLCKSCNQGKSNLPQCELPER